MSISSIGRSSLKQVYIAVSAVGTGTLCASNFPHRGSSQTLRVRPGLDGTHVPAEGVTIQGAGVRGGVRG